MTEEELERRCEDEDELQRVCGPMTMHFKIAPHAIRDGDVVEVWNDDAFVAAIYPGNGNTIRIVSKYETAIVEDSGAIIIAIDS